MIKVKKLNISKTNRLKIVRKKLNLTQKELSQILDVNENKIKSTEVGNVKISTELALAIEQKFNFSFKWLLTGFGEMMNDYDKIVQKTDSGNEDVLKNFKNQETARRLYNKLLRLEDISESQLDRVERGVDKLLEIAEDMASDMKKAEEANIKSAVKEKKERMKKAAG